MIKKFENYDDNYEEIMESFLDLEDKGFTIKSYSGEIVIHEFCIIKENKLSGDFILYFKNRKSFDTYRYKCVYFSINDVIDNIKRFSVICKNNNDNYRILLSNDYYLFDITNKLNNLNSVSLSDVVDRNRSSIGTPNKNIDIIKYLSLQVLGKFTSQQNILSSLSNENQF